MRITPLDIRKQEFRKTMRGLDSDEVYAFLSTVADEYEAVLSDNKKLRERIVDIEERLKEYKDIEANLRNTLLTAERITAEAKENARKEAGLILREAEIEADRSAGMIRDHTQQLRREILELKKHKDNYLTRLRTLLESHLRVIDGFEDDFASVDKEINEIGKMVEADSKATTFGTRMNRDRITEDFTHGPSDKVTWGDERKREEMPRPVVPKIEPQVEKVPERKAAGQPENEMTEEPGQGQDSTEAVTRANENTTKVEPHDVDAEHIDIDDEDDSSSVDGGLNSSEVNREVVHTIEERLYPEVHIRQDAAPMPQATQPDAGAMQEQSRQEMPAQQPSGQVPVTDTTQASEMDQVQSSVSTVVQSEPPAPQTQPENEETRQQDSWKSYEVKEGKTNWSSYELPDSGGQPQAVRAKESVADNSEVENALSGLAEMGDTSESPAVEPEVQFRKDAPKVETEPSPEPEVREEDSGSSWSMEELRKNLADISREEK